MKSIHIYIYIYTYIRAAIFLGLTRRTAGQFMSRIARVTLFRKYGLLDDNGHPTQENREIYWRPMNVF